MASWRPAVGAKLTDVELVALVRAEFERVGSPVHRYSCVIATESTRSLVSVTLTAPNGRVMRADAPTEAEALGAALAQQFKQANGEADRIRVGE